MSIVSDYTSFTNALKDYYQQTKSIKNQLSVLVYQNQTWQVIDPNTYKCSKSLYIQTVEKVLSFNINDKINPNDLIYWIKNFNSAMTLEKLKSKEIKIIDLKETKTQFNSMNAYSWLSNFFTTLIYDPEHRTLYPSVENGYVVFKAKQGQLDQKVIMECAHILDPKTVKQKGKDFWKHETEEDQSKAVNEMKRLVTLKFDQNPMIAGWLKKSTAQLEEMTHDDFWGSAMGTANGPNSNWLGKSIEGVRSRLK